MLNTVLLFPIHIPPSLETKTAQKGSILKLQVSFQLINAQLHVTPKQKVLAKNFNQIKTQGLVT